MSNCWYSKAQISMTFQAEQTQSSHAAETPGPDLPTGLSWRGQEMTERVLMYGEGKGVTSNKRQPILDWATLDISYGFRVESWNSTAAKADSLWPWKHKLQETVTWGKWTVRCWCLEWVSWLPSKKPDPEMKSCLIWNQLILCFCKRFSFHLGAAKLIYFPSLFKTKCFYSPVSEAVRLWLSPGPVS